MSDGRRHRSGKGRGRRGAGNAHPARAVHLLHDERHGVHPGALDDRRLRGSGSGRPPAGRLERPFPLPCLAFLDAGGLPPGNSPGLKLPGRTSAGASSRPTHSFASGVGAAFASSFFSVLGGGGPIYFEVGCVILVMTTLGRWLEATGRLKASSALDELARLLPETVRRLGATGEEVVPLDQVVHATCYGSCPASGSPPMEPLNATPPRGRASLDR